MEAVKTPSPWHWVPTLYLTEGLPYALALSVSVVVYKNLGLANRDITLYTGLLYLPWVIKPLWSPMVDLLQTRRLWIWTMELVVGAAVAAVALALPLPHFFQITLVGFWLLGFASATHDIAADGFYLVALGEREQSMFSGVRNLFYRVAGILARGQLVIAAGLLQKRSGNYASAWSLVLGGTAGLLVVFGLYHRFILPRPAADRPGRSGASGPLAGDFFEAIGSFFRKPDIITLLLFLLLYRFGEAQLMPVSQLFLLDPHENGGLGLTNVQVGFIYNNIGVGALGLGGLLGGWAVSRRGLKFWLWPMLLAIHLPDAVFIWLAYAQPGNHFAIAAGVALEQLGYGFGFTAFMLYLICLARGRHSTAHYALGTGFMALGMMVPGLWSGWLQEHLGYKLFFIWVILATVPSFVVAARIRLDPEFGRR